jgi:hypothetical protein
MTVDAPRQCSPQLGLCCEPSLPGCPADVPAGAAHLPGCLQGEVIRKSEGRAYTAFRHVLEQPGIGGASEVTLVEQQ